MLRHKLGIIALLSFAALLSAVSAMAAEYHVDPKPAGSIAAAALQKADALNIEDPVLPPWQRPPRAPRALGSSYTSPSPGAIVGDTWYEYQRHGSMRRMVGIGPHSGETGAATVHFHWSYMADASDFGIVKTYAYNRYDAGSGGFLPGGPVTVQPYDSTEYGGYVSGDVTKDNRYVAAGHNRIGGANSVQVYWDDSPGAGTFSTSSRVPDSLQNYASGLGGGSSAQDVIWPAIAYQETGVTPVTHVIGHSSVESGTGYEEYIYYFRKVGSGATGSWDYPPRVVDTSFVLSHDIAASRSSGKVAYAWTANIPKNGDCDTCSNNDGQPVSQQDNDVYVQWSNDWGATWQPRVNVTKYQRDVDGYRAYADLSVLIRSDDNISVVWPARVWPATASVDGTGAGQLRNIIQCWSEEIGLVRTVADFLWSQTTCNGGIWNLNASKVQLSECNNNLYCIWSQFNNGYLGVYDDCAARATSVDSAYQGAANGELWMAVSADNGLTWDAPRNLTNSYTPGCGPGTGVDCGNDVWPSVTRYGKQEQGGEDWSGATVVDPSGGGYTDNKFLDVQYIQDPDPGGSVQMEGSWALANVAWFRLACVEPVPTFYPIGTPLTRIDYPSWSKHGVQYDTSVTLQNTGNHDLNLMYTPIETDGPSGWLEVSPTTQTISSGLNNTGTIDLTFNPGGFINNPGTVVHLGGGLEIAGNYAGSPDTILIDHWIADTLVKPFIDTLNTGTVALVANSAGNYGNQGTDSVNMDFHGIDCDTTANTYLYDGSPVIGWVDGGDTVMNWSIFGTSYVDEDGFRPISSGAIFDTTGNAGDMYERFELSFMTNDSSVRIDRVWMAPKTGGGAGVSVGNYMVMQTTLTRLDNRPRMLLIGEVVDWDIPSDTTTRNGSIFDDTRGLLAQYGGEYNQDGATECQDNDARFGALAYIQGDQAGLSAYTADNNTFAYANGGFLAGQLYEKMINSLGFETYSSTDPDSVFADLHTAMVFRKNATLNFGDTLTFNTVLISVMNGSFVDVQAAYDDAKTWWQWNVENITCCCCVGTTGDVNGDGIDADPLDLSCMVDGLFGSGCANPCPEEMDFNGDLSLGDPVDLSYFVDFLFNGGLGPVPCQ